MNPAIGSLDGLSLAEKRALAAQLLRARSGADTPLVQHLIEVQAGRTPEAIAVEGGGVALSYDALNARADRLARRLRTLGVGPETLVGVCLGRSPAMVVGLLGVLKAGGAYVPLDPDYPASRLAYMLDDARVAVLLTERGLLARLPRREAEGVRTLFLDEPEALDADAGGAALTSGPARITGDSLAYVIYTSGSTGRPKGVQVTHGALVAFLQAMRGLLKPGAGDALLAVTTLSFDIAAMELFLPLIAGARVVLADRPEAMDGAPLSQRLGDPAITFLQATPATWRLLLEAGWGGRPDLTLLCGGEALPRTLADALLDRGKALWNLYGPTETTIWSTAGRVGPGADAPAIGHKIAGTEVYVLDRHCRPVPVGIAGELYLGGEGLARGYRNRAGLTAGRFLPDPFSRRAGSRLYRTGDLARWRGDGTLECLGRVDNQVKIRGFRVELGEIEAALLGHPAVRAAALAAHRDATGEQGLAAYLVFDRPGEGSPPGPAELRRWLLETLPEYMVPSAFVALDALPLTPNGKLDRAALPEPGPASRPASQGFTPPRGPVEQAVAGLWEEVLGCRRVGVHDNFFELGGHSLYAVQIQSRLRQTFGVEPGLRDFLEAPTVENLSQLVTRALAGAVGSAEPVPPIVRVPRDGPLPASFAQQRLWFLDQLDPGDVAYNIPAAVRVTGVLDVPALQRAIDEVVRRHEVLRTTIRAIGGVPHQFIAEVPAVPIAREDLSDRSVNVDPAEPGGSDRIRSEAGRAFDLAAGPLLRARLYRIGDREHVVQLTLHHIIADGWSMGVLVRELLSLYGVYRSRAGDGGPTAASILPELAFQYADYASWQRSWLSGETLARQVDYWREELAGVADLELPTDRPRHPRPRRRGGQRRLALELGLLDALKKLGRQEGATPFMTLLAAFQLLLHRYSGQADIAVGVPIAGRSSAALEHLIGFFVNTLVIRVDLAGDPGFRVLLGRVRSKALAAYAHQDLPFEQLVGALHPGHGDARRPEPFRVMFALQNQPPPSLAAPGSGAEPGDELEITPIDVTGGSAKFDLTLFATETPEGLDLSLEYDADLFNDATIERMLAHYRTLLEAVIAQPDRPIGALPMFSDEERRQMLGQGNPDPYEDLTGSLDGLEGEDLDALLDDLSAGRSAIDE